MRIMIESELTLEKIEINGTIVPHYGLSKNGESHSIVNLYMETFNISNSQSYRIIKRRYGSESHCLEFKEKKKPLNTTRANIFSDTWPTENIFAGGGR